MGGLEPVELDQDTTISRSFRSGTKHSSSGTNLVSLNRATARSTAEEPRLTLNERFAALSDSVLHCQEEANVSSRSNASVRSKLSIKSEY